MLIDVSAELRGALHEGFRFLVVGGKDGARFKPARPLHITLRHLAEVIRLGGYVDHGFHAVIYPAELVVANRSNADGSRYQHGNDETDFCSQAESIHERRPRGQEPDT